MVYSMISSARADRLGATSTPSALAVFRLMTSSNLVDCTTGRSAGLSPLRILTISFEQARSIADQAANDHELTRFIDGREWRTAPPTRQSGRADSPDSF